MPGIELRTVRPKLEDVELAGGELLACGVFEDERPFRDLAGLVDWRLVGRLTTLAYRGLITGKLGEIVMIPAKPRLPFDKVLVVGLGPRTDFTAAKFQSAWTSLLTAMEGIRVRRGVVEVFGPRLLEPGDIGTALAHGAEDESLFETISFVEEPERAKLVAERLDEERRKARRK